MCPLIAGRASIFSRHCDLPFCNHIDILALQSRSRLNLRAGMVTTNPGPYSFQVAWAAGDPKDQRCLEKAAPEQQATWSSHDTYVHVQYVHIYTLVHIYIYTPNCVL